MGYSSQQGGIRTKGELVAISEDRLDRVLGEPSTKIVLACLRSLDQDQKRHVFEKSHGDLKNEDGIRYIENVSTIVESGLWYLSHDCLPVVPDTTQDRSAINLDLQIIWGCKACPARRPRRNHTGPCSLPTSTSVHTTIGCGEQGFPSAQPYLNHTPAG